MVIVPFTVGMGSRYRQGCDYLTDTFSARVDCVNNLQLISVPISVELVMFIAVLCRERYPQ